MQEHLYFELIAYQSVKSTVLFSLWELLWDESNIDGVTVSLLLSIDILRGDARIDVETCSSWDSTLSDSLYVPTPDDDDSESTAFS